MNAEFERQVQSALDGSLSAGEQARLNDALRTNPAAREAWCRQMQMEALLRWRTGNVADTPSLANTRTAAAVPQSLRRWRWAGWAAAAVLLTGALLFIVLPNRAGAAVSRILAALERGDRSYAITVLAGEAQQSMNNGRTLSYNGAALYLRGDRQFVLIRPILEGGRRITGSDGSVNWDITGEAPVKVSRDVTRFRGGLPGDQQDAAFLDLRTQISRLQEGYDITLSKSPDRQELRRLTAMKRSREVRGPNQLVISFHPDSGVIESIEMRGLPRARGGPTALRLTLSSEAPLRDDFFTHAPHHEPGRRVEDADASSPRP